MNKPTSIIIGAGIAGIATAIRLAVKGHTVEIWEANAYPGGKLSAFRQEGYRFDAGPSLFTMPQFVDELFELAGRKPLDYFEYKAVPIACEYFYEDGTHLSAYADPSAFAQEVETKLGVKANKVLTHLKHSQKLYELTHKIFLEKSLHKMSTYLSWDVAKALGQVYRLNLTRSMDAVNKRKLGHPKLVQLFNRYATYNGSNPYQAPGVLNMIPHLEHNVGVFFPTQGMYSITQALWQLAEELGVKFHFNAPVTSIKVGSKGVAGIWANEEYIQADNVISNMDIVPTYRKLLKEVKAPEKTLAQERSSSALIFYWGINRTFSQLGLHNIFFSQDYAAEFDALFQQKTIHKDPTVYINISAKEKPSDAPKGCENWFVMVNAPANEGQDWDELIELTRWRIISKLNRMLDTDIRPLIETESILDPRSIETKTSSHQGALYGSSSNNRFSAFLRHPNFSQKVKGLYFCGGSAHPGGGIPLCLLSAKITAGLIENG